MFPKIYLSNKLQAAMCAAAFLLYLCIHEPLLAFVHWGLWFMVPMLVLRSYVVNHGIPAYGRLSFMAGQRRDEIETFVYDVCDDVRAGAPHVIFLQGAIKWHKDDVCMFVSKNQNECHFEMTRFGSFVSSMTFPHTGTNRSLFKQLFKDAERAHANNLRRYYFELKEDCKKFSKS